MGRVFPNATIHGIDIDETCRAQVEGRVTVTIADSTSPDDMARFTEDVGGDIDVVIDDGSHWYEDQIRSFKNLFPHVKYGGFYAIEDMGQADSPHNYRAQRAFEELVDGINYYPRFGNRLSWTHIHDFPDTDNYWIRNVVGISFYRYLTIVEKGHNPEDNPYAEEISGTTETTLAKRKFALDLDQRQRFGKLLRLIADSRKRHFISKREVRPSGYIRAARQKLFGV